MLKQTQEVWGRYTKGQIIEIADLKIRKRRKKRNLAYPGNGVSAHTESAHILYSSPCRYRSILEVASSLSLTLSLLPFAVL